MSIFELNQQHSPLVISVPHDGACIPDELLRDMRPDILQSTDRDLLIGDVFQWPDLPHSRIQARYSRHVIDLNRPASGEALYVGQAETELCPTTTFDHRKIYLPGKEPGDVEIKRRIEVYWRPYHQQLQQLIDRACAEHGWCLLIDAHSIDTQVPRFFDGVLPDINVGTFDGQSCGAQLVNLMDHELNQQTQFSHVLNGRFKGGFITRHYGCPEQHVHAIQLEHAKTCYLNASGQLSEQSIDLQQLWLQILTAMLAKGNKAT